MGHAVAGAGIGEVDEMMEDAFLLLSVSLSLCAPAFQITKINVKA